MSVGGDCSKNDAYWKDTTKELREFEKKKIIAKVVEVAILVGMNTHSWEVCTYSCQADR